MCTGTSPHSAFRSAPNFVSASHCYSEAPFCALQLALSKNSGVRVPACLQAQFFVLLCRVRPYSAMLKLKLKKYEQNAREILADLRRSQFGRAKKVPATLGCLQPGGVLLEEEPFAYVLLGDRCDDYCHFCFKHKRLLEWVTIRFICAARFAFCLTQSTFPVSGPSSCWSAPIADASDTVRWAVGWPTKVTISSSALRCDAISRTRSPAPCAS